jgi:CRP-like cAMP-binding protein
MPANVLRELLLSDAGLALGFASVLVERRRQVEVKLEHLVFRDVHARLAALLVELGDEYGVASDGSWPT